MKLQCFVFDLDGTLIDSGAAILAALRRMEEREKLAPLPEQTLRKFLGPPLKESFCRYYLASPREAGHLAEVYRDCYLEHEISRTVVFNGVPHFLAHIRACGGGTALATVKEHRLAAEILRRTGLIDLFDHAALDVDGTGNKAAQIVECLDRLGCDDPRQAVMFGDSPYDGRAAALAGVHFVPLTCGEGFRAPDSLKGIPHLFNAHDPKEMHDFICQAI